MLIKNEDEIPTKKLLADLKKSEASGVIRFKNHKEMFAYLDKMIEKAYKKGCEDTKRKLFEAKA